MFIIKVNKYNIIIIIIIIAKWNLSLTIVLNLFSLPIPFVMLCLVINLYSFIISPFILILQNINFSFVCACRELWVHSVNQVRQALADDRYAHSYIIIIHHYRVSYVLKILIWNMKISSMQPRHVLKLFVTFKQNCKFKINILYVFLYNISDHLYIFDLAAKFDTKIHFLNVLFLGIFCRVPRDQLVQMDPLDFKDLLERLAFLDFPA